MAQDARTISPEQSELDVLNGQFKAYIGSLWSNWRRENNRSPKYRMLYELDAEEQRRVAALRRSWSQYITPLAEAWWKERGYGVLWPTDESDRICNVFKLDAVASAA